MALLEHLAKQSALDELPNLQKQLAEQYAERISLEFALRNLDAEEFLRGYDFSLIHRISDETRQAIAYLVRRSFQLGIPPHRIALAIRDCLFLPASAIPAYLSQRSYLDEQRVPEKVALSSMSRWAKQRLDSRGELIARTETLRALNYGKIALWDRAMASGYLHPLSTQKEWIVAEDERLCPHCAPLDGEDVPLLGSWQTTLGTVSQPPLHPACRCTMGLVFKPQVQTSLLT